ncbi:hypothetical protein ACSFBI_04745 [Variovorax sp. RB3P1]|jgi:hypothetical protein
MHRRAQRGGVRRGRHVTANDRSGDAQAQAADILAKTCASRSS